MPSSKRGKAPTYYDDLDLCSGAVQHMESMHRICELVLVKLKVCCKSLADTLFG